MKYIRYLAFCLAFGGCFPVIAQAEVGDVTIRTDHPQYAGEGAFQTIEDCVAFATRDAKGEQEKAIAMYLWLLTHQWHLASPQEFNVPGVMPDTKRDSSYEMVVYDANRARFSYGYGLCGTVHAWNEPYWKALGMNARRRAFPGHTNSEIEYGGSWHAFDTDMAGLIFRKDGIVAGYEDVIENPALAANAKPPLPCYPFAWPGDFRVMLQGWQEIAKGGNWYKMYHSGYAAQPGVVHLRSGETFARYFDRDHFGGPTSRRFWHHQPGGPFRDWTFANNGKPHHEGAKSNARGNASYANGEFIYRPDLTSKDYRDETVSEENVALGPVSPRLRSANEGKCSVTFTHFSPYVICGDPADDANPMTAAATGGLGVSGEAVGQVRLEISADQGQSWEKAGEISGAFELDVTDKVKGRYGWQARFSWEGKGGLDKLQFTTVTQVCQAIYPRLKPSGAEVTYRAGSRAVVPVLPNLSAPDGKVFGEVHLLRSPNVTYSPRTKDSRYAYRTTNNKPGNVVFVIDSPTDLVEVTAAVRFGVRVPPPERCDFHLDVSLDGGKNWSLLGEAKMPADNEYSSGWMYGTHRITEPGIRSALVRVHLDHGGYQTGIIDAQLYGLRQTAAPHGVTVTYGWKENGTRREHVERIAAGEQERTFSVPTGSEVIDGFIRIEPAQ